ncbi:MAG: hypothetical protein HY329_26645 [Chloroflexi bacterium]|nr:hypothetical protein [Chloroflexota bacterium]
MADHPTEREARRAALRERARETNGVLQAQMAAAIVTYRQRIISDLAVNPDSPVPALIRALGSLRDRMVDPVSFTPDGNLVA